MDSKYSDNRIKNEDSKDSKNINSNSNDIDIESDGNATLIRLKSRNNESVDSAPVVKIVSRAKSEATNDEMVGTQFKSFQSITFEDLNQQIITYIAEGPKVISHLSCHYDGKMHNCMLETTYAEGSKLTIDGDSFEYRGQALINEGGEMMVQCY